MGQSWHEVPVTVVVRVRAESFEQARTRIRSNVADGLGPNGVGGFDLVSIFVHRQTGVNDD